MGAKLRTPIEIPRTSRHYGIERFQSEPRGNWVPLCREPSRLVLPVWNIGYCVVNYTINIQPHKGHLQTQIQAVQVHVLSSLNPSLISFSSFTFPGAPYQICLLFLAWLPCHFYLVVIEQQQLLMNNKVY